MKVIKKPVEYIATDEDKVYCTNSKYVCGYDSSKKFKRFFKCDELPNANRILIHDKDDLLIFKNTVGVIAVYDRKTLQRRNIFRLAPVDNTDGEMVYDSTNKKIYTVATSCLGMLLYICNLQNDTFDCFQLADREDKLLNLYNVYRCDDQGVMMLHSCYDREKDQFIEGSLLKYIFDGIALEKVEVVSKNSLDWGFSKIIDENYSHTFNWIYDLRKQTAKNFNDIYNIGEQGIKHIKRYRSGYAAITDEQVILFDLDWKYKDHFHNPYSSDYDENENFKMIATWEKLLICNGNEKFND